MIFRQVWVLREDSSTQKQQELGLKIWVAKYIRDSKRYNTSNSTKNKLQMCEVEVINVTTQYCWLYPIVHNTQWDTTLLKKVLKSDDKKVGQRFISWENYLTLHHLTMHSRLFTHIWPGPLLQQHCIITPSQLTSLKGGFHKIEWCPSAIVREYLKHGKSYK